MAAPHFPPRPHRLFGFPTLPPPQPLTNTQGCDPPAGGCGDLCLGRLPTRGLLLLLGARHPLTPLASPRSWKRRGRHRLLAHLPRTRALPSPQTPAPAAPPPPRGIFVSRGTFCLFPRGPRGETGLPRRPNGQQAPGAAATAGDPAKEPVRYRTPPHPRKCLGDPGFALDQRGDRHSELPWPRLPLLTSRPGLSLLRPQQPPAPTLRPKHPPGPSARGPPGSGKSPASRQLTSKCGGRVARRGAEGKRLRRHPRRPDAGPGPSGWQTQGASEAQASAAAFRLSPRVRSLREGPRVPHALPSPPDNMAPGPPSREGSPLIPSEEPGRERGCQGGADARLRRPARTRAPSSLLPDREELRRPRAAAFVRCVCVAFSLGGCGLTPPPVPRRRASEREKRLLLKRSNQQQQRKATRRGSFPHPRLSSSPRAARPLLAAAAGRSWRSRGGA